MSEVERTSNETALNAVYLAELRDHALTLVWMGYQRMLPADYSKAEEDTITGELARHMDEITQDETAPLWTEHYSVKEQVRSHTSDKFGKRRPIVDIEFERHKRGKRPRLRFEAKRLGRGATVADYCGGEGLGAFVDCHYSRTHNEVGMLGYVQTGTEHHWSTKLEAELVPRVHGVIVGGEWKRVESVDGPPHTFQTIHKDKRAVNFFLLHVLLGFARLSINDTPPGA
jgi:hypothetical protein